MTFLESYFQDNNKASDLNKSWGLGIDTSCQIGRLSFFNKDGLIKESSWGREKRHSESLILEFEENVKNLNLNLDCLSNIFLGIGPGSFTGIRVSCSFIKSLSFATKAQIFCFPSLRILASKASLGSKSFSVATPSIGDLVFYSKYRKQGNKFIEQISYKTQNLKTLISLDNDPLYLDSSARDLTTDIDDQISFLDTRKISLFQSLVYGYNNKLLVCRSTHLDLTPLYLRLSEAEEKFKSK